MRTVLGFLICVSIVGTSNAQQRFADLVGNLSAQPVQQRQPVAIPFITWGGDVATFQANGGLKTKPGSTFQKLGLNAELTPGDNFPQQVKDYMSGKSPFLRGTYRMLAQANEVLGSSPSTKPVVIMQLSWSGGDHIVSRARFKTLNDLRGQGKKVRVACQQGGPHVGLLYDALTQAKLGYSDVEIKWVADLTGPNGPAELFRKDSSIDACCVITPDMIGLTGGLQSTGSGAEGTVAGAKVLVSTQTMSRSIADVYAVRSDWYADSKNKQFVNKFVAGYLSSAKTVVDMRKRFEDSQRLSPDYRASLKMAQRIFGSDVLPTLEVDAHGLLLDCNFVGLPGQMKFFEDKGNVTGFERMMAPALEMARSWGYSGGKFGFASAGLNYREIAKISGLKYEAPRATAAIVPGADIKVGKDNKILSFTIGFETDQIEFPAAQYGAEFKRAIESAAVFGNAVVKIRGHSDHWLATTQLLRAGMKNGSITRTGKKPNYIYSVDNKPLNITSTKQVEALIQTGKFEKMRDAKGDLIEPMGTLTSATWLAKRRSEAVRESLMEFAREQGINIDKSQVQTEAVGIMEPVVLHPRNPSDAQKNRRVEFAIIRVPAERLKADDFDF